MYRYTNMNCNGCLCPVTPCVAGVFKGNGVADFAISAAWVCTPGAMGARVGSGCCSLPLHGARCWLGILFMVLANVTGDIPACNEMETTNMKKRRVCTCIFL